MTPTHGSLILLSAGKEIIMLDDKPFALIQSTKSSMVMKQWYRKENLRIKYKQ